MVAMTSSEPMTLSDVRTATEPTNPYARRFGISLIVYSVIAFFASFVLVLERIALYQDPGHTASCDFGGIFSCTGVMQTEQAALFGFPNPFLGIVGFAVTGAIGLMIATLPRGQKLQKPMVVALALGAIFAMGLVSFFWFTSVINLMLLCPWCMVVWAMVIPLFFHTMAYASRELFGAKVEGISDWWWLGVLISYLFVVGSILVQFAEYIF